MEIPGFTPQHRIVANHRPDQNIIGMIEGSFILDGTTIFLQLADSAVYELKDVAMTSYAFNSEDGILRYPQPSQFDKKGNQLIQGDVVLVGFRKSRPDNPIVLGSIIPLNRSEFFHAFEYDVYHQKKARFVTDQATIEFSDNGEGEILLNLTAVKPEDTKKNVGTGNITVNLIGYNENEDGLNGTITINTNGNVNINTEKQVNVTAQKEVTVTTQSTANITAVGAVTVKSDEKTTVDSPEIYFGDGATQPLVLGTSWASLFKAHIHSTPTGPSGPPTTAAQADSCLSGVSKTL